MSSVMSFVDNIVFKRAKLCGICMMSYSDVFLDAINAYKLFKRGNVYWGSCMTAFLFVPNFLTWNFLYASSVAELKDLAMVMLQLGPLHGLYGSWQDGKIRSELLWYTASEGLLEAPCTGLLTAYIMTFGGEFSITFYLSIIASFLSIAKTAVMINFYGKNVSLVEQGLEFLSRFFDITLRISSLACFGYLMRNPGGITDMDEDSSPHSNIQSALPASVLSSFLTSTCMIAMTEPKCELKVSLFFGSCMVFTPPLRFLNVFEQMYAPFIVYRSVETLFLTCIAIFPLQLNPQLWELSEQCPFVVFLVLGSAACQVAFYLIKLANLACIHCFSGRSEGYQQIVAKDSASERAELLQATLFTSVSSKDILMTNVLVQFGAKLNDAKIVNAVLTDWPKDACDVLKKKGMPSSLQGFSSQELQGINPNPQLLKEARIDAKELKGARFKATELKEAGFEAIELREAGFEAIELREAGFEATELKGVGFEATEMKGAGFTATELKELGFEATELKGAGFEVTELKGAGFEGTKLREAGFEARLLKELGFNLKEAGFQTNVLYGFEGDGGFDIKQLREEGFEPVDFSYDNFQIMPMFKAGFSARDMVEAGFMPRELYNSGVMWSPADKNELAYVLGQPNARLPDGYEPTPQKDRWGAAYQGTILAGCMPKSAAFAAAFPDA